MTVKADSILLSIVSNHLSKKDKLECNSQIVSDLWKVVPWSHISNQVFSKTLEKVLELIQNSSDKIVALGLSLLRISILKYPSVVESHGIKLFTILSKLMQNADDHLQVELIETLKMLIEKSKSCSEVLKHFQSSILPKLILQLVSSISNMKFASISFLSFLACSFPGNCRSYLDNIQKTCYELIDRDDFSVISELMSSSCFLSQKSEPTALIEQGLDNTIGTFSATLNDFLRSVVEEPFNEVPFNTIKCPPLPEGLHDRIITLFRRIRNLDSMIIFLLTKFKENLTFSIPAGAIFSCYGRMLSLDHFTIKKQISDNSEYESVVSFSPLIREMAILSLNKISLLMGNQAVVFSNELFAIALRALSIAPGKSSCDLVKTLIESLGPNFIKNMGEQVLPKIVDSCLSLLKTSKLSSPEDLIHQFELIRLFLREDVDLSKEIHTKIDQILIQALLSSYTPVFGTDCIKMNDDLKQILYDSMMLSILKLKYVQSPLIPYASHLLSRGLLEKSLNVRRSCLQSRKILETILHPRAAHERLVVQEPHKIVEEQHVDGDSCLKDSIVEEEVQELPTVVEKTYNESSIKEVVKVYPKDNNAAAKHVEVNFVEINSMKPPKREAEEDLSCNPIKNVKVEYEVTDEDSDIGPIEFIEDDPYTE